MIDFIGMVIMGRGPLKFLRNLGLQNLGGPTILARFASSPKDLVAGFIPRFTKDLDETTVGKSEQVVWCLQVNKSGQAVQQGIELFPFYLQGYLSLFALGRISYGPEQQLGICFPFDQIILSSL